MTERSPASSDHLRSAHRPCIDHRQKAFNRPHKTDSVTGFDLSVHPTEPKMWNKDE